MAQTAVAAGGDGGGGTGGGGELAPLVRAVSGTGSNGL